MNAFTAEPLDLSRLDAALLVEVDFEARLQANLDLLLDLWRQAREINPALPVLNTTSIASQTAVILNDEFSQGQIFILQAINDAADALRLAKAGGANLDHLAATYHRTQRQIIVAATGSSAAIYENDAELRARAQLAPEALADLAMTPGGYIYMIRTGFADRIKDVRPIRRGGGHVELRLLGRTGSGAVDPAIIAEILRAFNPEGMTQSTDILSVFSADIDIVTPRLTLVIGRGPDPVAVAAAARSSLAAYAASVHRIGKTVYREALAAAAHVSPVITVRVDEPAEDIIGDIAGAPYIDPAAIIVETEVI